MKKINVILIIALCVFVSACAKDVVTGKSTLNYFSLAQEPKLGEQVLKSQLTDLGKSNKAVDAKADPKDYALIKSIVKRIAAVSHYPEFPYEVHLADAPVVNAWCAPGGKIMVYTGLWDPKKGLVQRGNADELAAVLAHEIAHANARHVTESISKNMTIVMVGSVAQSAIAAGGSSEGANLFGEIFTQGLNLYLPSYSRKNEKEADRLGIVYMAKAGYDPRVAIALWQRAAKGKKEKTSVYASHPASGERARALEKALPEAMAEYEATLARQGRRVPPPPANVKEPELSESGSSATPEESSKKPSRHRKW